MNEPFNENNNQSNSNHENEWQNPYLSNGPTYDDHSESNDYQYPNEPRYPSSQEYSNDYSQSDVDVLKRKAQRNKVFVALILVVSLVVVAIGSYFIFNVYNSDNKNFSSTSSESTGNGVNPDASPIPIKDLTGDEDGLTASQVYQNNVESTVGIVVFDPSSGSFPTEKSQGTGVIVSSDGYIVTNSHVIANSKKSAVTVVLNSEKEVSGTVVGYDVRTDLAVVKIEETGLKPIQLGNSDQMAVGEWVIAIGNPGGLDFVNSLTRGVVSAVNRSLGASNLVTYIQTDAAINPGNSGGPLIDMHGRVIGINTAKISVTGYEGMGFAIPSNLVKKIADDIISKGYVSGRAYIGISTKEIPSAVSQMYNIPQGILIREIFSDSSLSGKNVRVGDIITKVNGTPVTTSSALFNELAAHSPGDTVRLTIYRVDSRKSNNVGETSYVDITLLEDKGQTQDQSSTTPES